MYRVGQSVVHPMHGAGVIEGETNEILEGTARTYYVFRSPVRRRGRGCGSAWRVARR